jgi:hypothetical protein
LSSSSAKIGLFGVQEPKIVVADFSFNHLEVQAAEALPLRASLVLFMVAPKM